LILGATGQLGSDLVQAAAAAGVEHVALNHEQVEVTDAASLAATLRRVQPVVVINSAAFHQVDKCEDDPAEAYRVNAVGALLVARAAKDVGAHCLYVSTDYVFDGASTMPYKASDPRAPKSVYGASKAEAEVKLLEVMTAICIVRTSWVFGVGGKCFPETILKLAATRPQLDVVTDQRGCPTYTVDLARAIIQLCRKDASGIVHVTNSGDCTWFEFAQEIVAGAGLSTKILPTTSDKFVRPAERPKYSVLSSKSLEQYQVAMPTWQDALHRYLTERKS